MVPSGEGLKGMQRMDRRDKTYITGLCLWRVTDVYFTILHMPTLILEGKKKNSQSHRIYHARRRQFKYSTTANGSILYFLSPLWWQCCSRKLKRWPLFLPSNQMTERVSVYHDYLLAWLMLSCPTALPSMFSNKEIKLRHRVTFNYITSVLLLWHQMSNIWCQGHFTEFQWVQSALNLSHFFLHCDCAKLRLGIDIHWFCREKGIRCNGKQNW